MVPESFPGSGQDGQEPHGSGPLPAGGGGCGDGGPWPEDDRDGDAAIESLVAAVDAGRYQEPPEGPGAVQGLFVCLPAEQLTLPGFAQDGPADTMTPGPLLAAVVHAVTGEDGAGLAALSDDQLLGVISAARRMESRAAWT